MAEGKSPMLCCACPPSDLDAHEIEILNSGQTDELDLEEEAAPEEAPLDLRKMQRELLCIKSVVEKYQAKLQSFLEPCPSEPCVDFETELACSPHPAICALQRSQHRLECQVKELSDCCRTAKAEFKRLRSSLCSQKQEIRELQKHVAALESWRRTLEQEAGLCIERFEYLKHVKAEWTDVTNSLAKERECYKQAEQKLVPKECYVRDKEFFLGEIKKLRQMFTELYELQHTKFQFHCDPDTPTKGSELDLAEREYLSLKQQFTKLKDNATEVAEK